MDMPDINSDAAMHMINPVIIVNGVIVKEIVLNKAKDFEAMKILIIVNNNPINEAINPVITVARYLPVISSLAVTGNVKIVSRVPFSFSTAVADVAIFVPARTIDIIM